jgi:peptidoglycan/LPS O-acetylase OafA/YrhL
VPGHRPARRSIGSSFDPRHNALNLLRLVLAVTVIFSHSLILGGFRRETLWGHGTLGDLAVDAFFAISGFLITASAARTPVLRYLWQRFVRIFPAFWVCLVVTSLLAGPAAWAASGRPLGRYWSAPLGPVHYLVADWWLDIKVYSIAGTPRGVPVPGAWDGSLWTLRWEFLCYLLIAALAVSTVLRRRQIVLAMWLLSWAAALGAAAAGLPTYTDTPAHDLLRFLPVFLAGAVLWLYRDRVPDHGLLFAVALGLAVAGTWLRNPDVLTGPPLAYVCTWAAIHLPGKRIGARYDISYGMYIYAFVIAQLLALGQLERWGYVPFTLLTIAVTSAAAGLSCVAVERPALRLKGVWPRLPGARAAARAAAAGAAAACPPDGAVPEAEPR